MDCLKIDKTEATPKVFFDPENALFEISGRSIPADAKSFYEPLQDWLREYHSENRGQKMTLEMNLEYFNTASHKYIAEIFKSVKEFSPESVVNWHFHVDDEEMKQVGEIFNKLFGLEFRMVSFKDD